MYNFYELIRDGLTYNKFELDGSICVEYNCPIENESAGIFSQNDYIVHSLSGKKTWKTLNGEYEVLPGETIYIRKVAIVKQVN